jgi:2-polyprenyl-3-methyl-5-hydroxy-6-metoxy-1,4-benzoquinol methylase
MNTKPTMNTLAASSPNLARIVEIIGRQNPLQRKRIDAFLSVRDTEYWGFAESLSRTLNDRLLKSQESAEEAARAYNRMCMDFLKEQIRFKKTGKYLIDDAAVAHAEVYSKPEVMRYYMIGLLLSYMFWPNHYAMLRFLDDHLEGRVIRNYLEIAPGHGLFATHAIHQSPGLKATLVDISPTSLEVSKSILGAFDVDVTKLRIVQGDFLKVEPGGTGFDFISMGEVLEHVNEADVFLARAEKLLSDDGVIFMTTCANCPALDHVYHFHNVKEIRELIAGAGLRVVADMSLPSDPFPENMWETELVTVNYCCILEKA